MLFYSEKFTGTTTERPKFSQLLNRVQSGDTIVVTKPDRFARNTREALEIIEPLMEREVAIRVLNLGVIENSPMGKMILRTLLSVAEMEWDMIIQRTQEGKEYAKKHNPNYREGRPHAQITPQKQLAYDLLKDHLYKQVSSMTGFSVPTLQRIKKMIEAESLPTVRDRNQIENTFVLLVADRPKNFTNYP